MTHFKRTFVILFCLSFGLIIVLSVLIWQFNERYVQTFSRVRHTLVVLNEAENLTATINDPNWLHNTPKIIEHINSLNELTRDNFIQQQRIDSLKKLFTAVVPRILATGEITNAQGSIHDVALALLASLRLEESRLLTMREAVNARSKDKIKNVTPIFLAGILCILVLFFFTVLFNFLRRKKAEGELRESEKRFSVLVDAIKDYAIFMVDPDGKIISWNQGASQMKGYTAPEVIGQSISIFYTEEDNLRREPEQNLRKARENGHFESIGWRRRKDASLFWADAVITSLFDNAGHLTGYIKITKDISVQRIAEEEMRNALKREKDLNEMKSRFVSLASHEFKTPLSVILSSINLIEKYNGPEHADKRLKHIQKVKSNVDNLRHILDDFLSLDKLEEGVMKNQPIWADLAQLANETIHNMQEDCKMGQDIQMTVEGLARKIPVDIQLLRNVLNNLLSNAIKYSPEFSPISLHIRFGPETVSFIVKDNGIGIPQGEQEHLFERFFRATNATSISGTGLGLSIVKKYIDLMGGNITARSEPGSGTEFTVVLRSENLSDIHYQENDKRSDTPRSVT